MRAAIWVLLTTIFGLMQLVVVMLICLFDTEKNFDWGNVIKDCSVLFFCSGLAASIALDRFNLPQKKSKLSQIGFVYVLFPSFIIAGSVIINTVVYLGSPDYLMVASAQILIFVMTIIYSFSIKIANLK